jgi:hypothetical protein
MAKSVTGSSAQTTCTYHDIHEPDNGNHAPVEFAQECLFQAVSRQSRGKLPSSLTFSSAPPGSYGSTSWTRASIAPMANSSCIALGLVSYGRDILVEERRSCRRRSCYIWLKCFDVAECLN